MNIPLRIVGAFPEARKPGMMWRDPTGDEAGRECWRIILPDPRGLCGLCGKPGAVSEIAWRTADRASSPPHEMRTVTGAAPLLTVTPSIDVEYRTPANVRDGSYWHGFIANGELVG